MEENIIDENLKDIAKKYYYFKISIPVIESLTLNTRDFEENTLKKVFNNFETIWNESETIVKESEKSMVNIFDTKNQENMGYILNSSREINREFESFLPELSEMRKLTDLFMETSLRSFREISKTTYDIEDLAEQVKVISINVRIEAARIRDSGGFKVLGQDITNFANKTTNFAQGTHTKINETLKEIEKLKMILSDKIQNVQLRVDSMYKKVSPFESILEKSASSLKNVIHNLNKVSGELNSNLKTSLGNLQYQDVTRQETEHIISFLKTIDATIGKNIEIEKCFNKQLKKQKLKNQFFWNLNSLVQQEMRQKF
jgi:methyl-accepting chemotaxis protein